MAWSPASPATTYITASSGTGNLVVTPADRHRRDNVGSVLARPRTAAPPRSTATLTDTAIGAGVAGETVDFTLDGTSVGSAVTNSDGVATLSEVTTSDGVGTGYSAVVASFGGDDTYIASTGAGNLVVSQAATNLSVACTSTYGTGLATLTATLTSAVTGKGIAGETISFTLDGTALTTAVTNSDGVATLSSVATTDGLGVDANGVTATFSGDDNYTGSTATGNLFVSNATTVASVSGSATYGGTATLAATLTNSATMPRNRWGDGRLHPRWRFRRFGHNRQ